MQVFNDKNKNCFGNKFYSISHRFNPLYEKNLNEMLHSISLSLLVGFKVSNINNRKRSTYIKLILLSKYIEYYNTNTKKQLEYHLKNPLEKDLTLEKGNKNV